MPNRRYRFHLSIPPDVYLAYYQGSARAVVAVAHNGQRVQFPANLLRSHVTYQGVFGEFELEVDEHNKAVGFRRVGY